MAWKDIRLMSCVTTDKENSSYKSWAPFCPARPFEIRFFTMNRKEVQNMPSFDYKIKSMLNITVQDMNTCQDSLLRNMLQPVINALINTRRLMPLTLLH
jgi:hypothetical protein